MLVVVLVAVSIFAGTVTAMVGQRAVNRESAIATEAARVVVEQMHNQRFRELWARYNSDPADDPEGAGTAPGQRFAVLGLDPAPGAADGLVGEVVLPTVEAPGAGPLDPPELELREDFEHERLGMPRDLNGDMVVDDEDHSEDFFLLPVLIHVEWSGCSGTRRIELFTMLCEYRHDS